MSAARPSALSCVAAAAATVCRPLRMRPGRSSPPAPAAPRWSPPTAAPPARRSTTKAIELKIANQVNAQYGDRVHVNVTSYNGVVLLTGEVPDQGAWASLGNFAKSTEKVRSRPERARRRAADRPFRSAPTTRYITSKVKARFVEANKFPPNAVKVVTERGVVYLMGIVTRPEGDSAGEVAATTVGVVKVVKVFEYRA